MKKRFDQNFEYDKVFERNPIFALLQQVIRIADRGLTDWQKIFRVQVGWATILCASLKLGTFYWFDCKLISPCHGWWRLQTANRKIKFPGLLSQSFVSRHQRPTTEKTCKTRKSEPWNDFSKPRAVECETFFDCRGILYGEKWFPSEYLFELIILFREDEAKVLQYKSLHCMPCFRPHCDAKVEQYRSASDDSCENVTMWVYQRDKFINNFRTKQKLMRQQTEQQTSHNNLSDSQ